MKLSLFVPVYNEERILAKSIRELSVQCAKMGSYELIIIDDTSQDKTGALADALAKKDRRIRVLHYKNGPSRRENLGVSFPKAKGELVGFCDVDLAPDINRLGDMIAAIERGADIAIGSRYKGIAADREFSRLFISKVYNGVIRLMFGSRVRDHQCGLKVFRRAVALQLAAEAGYDSSFTRGWSWDAEMLIRAQRHQFKIAELPLKWVRGEKSSFNWKRELRIVKYLLRLRLQL